MEPDLKQLLRAYAEKLRGKSLAAVFLRGAGSFVIVNVLAKGVSFGSRIVLARLLGVDHYGVYAYVLTWVTLLLVFSLAGMEITQVRLIARYNVEKQWGNLRGLLRRGNQVVLLASVVVGGGIALVISLLGGRLDAETARAFYIACGLVPVLSLLLLRQSGLRAFKRVGLSKIPNVAVRPFVLMALVLWVYIRGDIYLDGSTAVALDIIAAVIALSVASYWLRRTIPEEMKQAKPAYETRNWLGIAFPLLLVAGMQRLMAQTDTLLVGIIVGTTEAGIYDAAWRIASFVPFGLVAGGMIVAPMISELYHEKKYAQLQSLVTLSCWSATVFALVVGGGAILGRTYILNLFGEGFVIGQVAMIVLVVGQIIGACTGPVGHLLHMTAYERTSARINMITAGSNLLLNFPAILIWGIEGAAIVTASLFAITNIWQWFEVRRLLGINSSVFGSLSKRTRTF